MDKGLYKRLNYYSSWTELKDWEIDGLIQRDVANYKNAKDLYDKKIKLLDSFRFLKPMERRAIKFNYNQCIKRHLTTEVVIHLLRSTDNTLSQKLYPEILDIILRLVSQINHKTVTIKKYDSVSLRAKQQKLLNDMKEYL